MVSIERIKELLEDPDISDEEAKEIRDGFYMLAEIIFEHWQEERENKKVDHISDSEHNNEID